MYRILEYIFYLRIICNMDIGEFGNPCSTQVIISRVVKYK